MNIRSIDDVIGEYPKNIRSALNRLRQLIHEVADETENAGKIEETLKWGQPAFSTVSPKSGSPVRIDRVKGLDNQVAIYFICTTTLVETFRQHYSDRLNFSDNRAIFLDADQPLPEEELKHCLGLALTFFVK